MSPIKKIFVTGAAGKLGRPLCGSLVENGYQVVALRHRTPIDVDGVEEIAVDLRDVRPEELDEVLSGCDAILHLATCKEDREGVIGLSARGTFLLLEAASRLGINRFIKSSGDAVNGIYFNDKPRPIREDEPLAAYPGYYPLSLAVEETLCNQYYHQRGLFTVILRISWIHCEDDILTHLTVGGEGFGVPVWSELMSDEQQARVESGWNAAVALKHPDGSPMRRHIVAVEDCVQAFHLALLKDGIAGETFNIAMPDPFDYVDAAEHTAKRLGIDTIELVDPIGRDFCMDVTKAKYVLGYRPQYDIHALIEKAAAFRESGEERSVRTGYVG